MKKATHVPQQKRKLTISPPLRAVRVGPMAPRMQEPGQEVDNALPAGTQNASFSDEAGLPRAKAGVRKVAVAAAGKRPAKPLSARFKSLAFGSSTNPFQSRG